MSQVIHIPAGMDVRSGEEEVGDEARMMHCSKYYKNEYMNFLKKS